MMLVPGLPWSLRPSSESVNSTLDWYSREQGSLFPLWAQESILLGRSGYQHFSFCLQVPIAEGKVLGKCHQVYGGREGSLFPYNLQWWDVGFNFPIKLLGHWLLLFQLLRWEFHTGRPNPSRHVYTIPFITQTAQILQQRYNWKRNASLSPLYTWDLIWRYCLWDEGSHKTYRFKCLLWEILHLQANGQTCNEKQWRPWWKGNWEESGEITGHKD